MTYEVDFAETDPEYRRLFAALGTPEQWSTFTHAWDDLIRQAEQAGIPAEKFAGMFAWALGAMIGGQPPGKKQDEILRDAWNTCMHGANHAGMDTMAWMERMNEGSKGDEAFTCEGCGAEADTMTTDGADLCAKCAAVDPSGSGANGR